MSPYSKNLPVAPRGTCRCRCGAYITKGAAFLTHIRQCPEMQRIAGDHGVKPESLYTPHGWREPQK